MDDHKGEKRGESDCARSDQIRSNFEMNVDDVNVGQEERYLGFDALDDDGGL